MCPLMLGVSHISILCTQWVIMTLAGGDLSLMTFWNWESSSVVICFSYYLLKKIIYQLRKSLKICEINQRLKLSSTYLVSIRSYLVEVHIYRLHHWTIPSLPVSSSRKNTRVTNATFIDNWQNLQTQYCSPKAINGNRSWMY